MPIGMVGMYRLLFVCVYVCVSAGFFVRDISGLGWRRVMKFGRMVELGVEQVISPFNELWPRGWPLSRKVKNFSNTYLADRLRAEIL